MVTIVQKYCTTHKSFYDADLSWCPHCKNKEPAAVEKSKKIRFAKKSSIRQFVKKSSINRDAPF